MKLRLRPHHAPRFHTVQPADDSLTTTLPLSGFRQARPYTCGFATGLMVLRYFGVDVPAMELYRRLGTGQDGTRQNSILRELRAGGLRVNMRYDVDFSRICCEVDRNKLIVGYLHDIEHWLVIYGYGREPERIFIADPRPEERRCEHPWEAYSERLNSFGIICSLPGESHAIRQEPLGLANVPAASQPSLDRPPPPPARELRCEVHGGPAVIADPTPAQLTLPF